MKMIVGLGNPGGKYADTRHNIGFKVIDLLADFLDIKVSRRKFGGRFGTGDFNNHKLILLKPWRFMNISGQVVAAAVDFYGLGLSDLLVVLDDMALAVGRIRLRASGSAGGHNGLVNIIENLGSEDFARCRVGIGAGERTENVDYVLGRPGKKDKLILDEAVNRAKDAALWWIERGIDSAMNQFNG